MKSSSLVLLCVSFTLLVSFSLAEKKIVCYVGTWAYYRPGLGKFDIENINPGLCTHLMYAFFGINVDGTIRIIDAYLDLEENWGRGHIRRFNQLKSSHTNLKTMAAIGGWNEGSYKFSVVAASPTLRRRFIQECVEFCAKHNFDGIDLDWEYPGQRDSTNADDKDNHATWLEEFREEFSRRGLLLSAAVASAEFSSGKSYDIPRVSAALDFINVMAYDMHGSWDNYTGLNSPMYEGPADVTDLQKQLNVHASIQYWLSQGADRDKIVLGVPLYGRTFTLANAEKNYIGAPSNAAGMAGPYSREAGFLGYNELCEMLPKENWEIHPSMEQHGFYATKGNQWIGFENVETIKSKLSYMEEQKLGGIMVWSLESDDFHGTCGIRYELMNAIYRFINNGALPPTTESTSTTSTTTTVGPTQGDCFPEGVFPNPESCKKYFVCTIDGRRFDFECPGDLLFDPVFQYCNWPEAVSCVDQRILLESKESF